jgi:uncharacterized protein
LRRRDINNPSYTLMNRDGVDTLITSPRGRDAKSWRLWPTAWRVARAVLTAYLVVLVAAMLLEKSLIYFPVPYPQGYWNHEGLDVEDAWFQATDGTRLHGWYLPRQGREEGGLACRASLLFCHGNGGNITHRCDALWKLTRMAGVSVLIFDYRGYGRSEGTPSESGVVADARAARAWLAARDKIAESAVVLFGESLGGAVAVDLAAGDGARALVLEGAFSSLPDVAAYHYPFLPVRWAMRSRFDSLGKIGRYHGPLLVAHGDADTIVPIALGRRLFEAANQPKQFVLMPGHDHNDLLPVEFYAAVDRFIERLGQ